MTDQRGSVLLVMPRFQGYENTIPEALRQMGYTVGWSDARSGNSFMSKVLTRLGVLQRIKRISQAHIAKIAQDARDIAADTIFILSPEQLGHTDVAHLKRELPDVRVVLYIWDTSVNRPIDQDMVDLVDRAYSFDMNDCATYANLTHVPLFHPHDTFTPAVTSAVAYDYDYCFIGTARFRRLKVLAQIAQKIRPQGARYFFYLYAPSFVQYTVLRLAAWRWQYDGVLSRESVPFQTYLATLAKSACVIDIEQQGQGGLTIRTMDAVFSGAPFVTTNANIAQHDFFPHFPINVFSTDTLDLAVPKAQDNAQAAVYFQKYHIHTWLDTILTGREVSYHIDDQAASDA